MLKQKLLQPSTWAGLGALAVSIAHFFTTGVIDVNAVVGALTGAGLIAADA